MSPQHPTPDSFHTFIARLLHELMSSNEPSTKLPPEFAALWKATGDFFGLHQLLLLIQHNQHLLSLLSKYSEQPLHALHTPPPNEASQLELSTALRHFTQGIPLGAQGDELQRQYLFLLENLENDFLRLKHENIEGTIDDKELDDEVEQLFTKALYNLSRISRN